MWHLGVWSCILPGHIYIYSETSVNFFILVRRSCQELRDVGYMDDGEYILDPDGLDPDHGPVTVFCNMTGRLGLAETHVRHDSQDRTHVDGCEPRDCYSRPIRYSMPMAQIIALVKNSAHCIQLISYECKGSQLIHYASWQSRTGERRYYWAGASPVGGNCACGITQSCNDSTIRCNCNKNDGVWRSDVGYLSDKASLPVTNLYYGDTGSDSDIEEGYHTLGPLVCYGSYN